MKNPAYLEAVYAKKWDEIWNGDIRTVAYKKLKKIYVGGVKKKRIDYGKFWESK